MHRSQGACLGLPTRADTIDQACLNSVTGTGQLSRSAFPTIHGPVRLAATVSTTPPPLG